MFCEFYEFFFLTVVVKFEFFVMHFCSALPRELWGLLFCVSSFSYYWLIVANVILQFFAYF